MSDFRPNRIAGAQHKNPGSSPNHARHRPHAHRARTAALTIAAALAAPCALASAQAPVSLAVVTLLSGPSAPVLGLPALRAAELMVQAINAGELPPPYTRRGLGGAPIALTLVDEAGTSTAQVDAYRSLVGAGDVDAVIGYTDSANCMAIAPLADAFQQLTVFSDCGAPQIFEDADRKYLFRTGNTSTVDDTAAALYVAEMRPELRRVAGIDGRQAGGTRSGTTFETALKTLLPKVRVVASTRTDPAASGDFEGEIAVVRAAELVHTDLSGSAAETLLLQAAQREMFRRSSLLMPSGGAAIQRLGTHVPEGTIVGARGPFEGFAPDTALQRWFRSTFERRYYVPPSYPAYKMAQAILGLKSAWEAAQDGKLGARPPKAQVVAAFEHLTFEGPGGQVQMGLGKGHQATQETAYGTVHHVNGRVTLVDVRRYPAALTSPPEGSASTAWLRTHFGARLSCPA